MSDGRYPCLTKPKSATSALGDIGFLRHDYLLKDYVADIAGQGVVASAHVEAVWDPARSPVEEVAWLDALPRPHGIAAGYVVAGPDVAALLDADAASRRVAAVCKTIRWHPDPAKHWACQGIVREPAWRRSLAQLGKHGWALDLVMNPHQAGRWPPWNGRCRASTRMPRS